jgi:uncharacterized protein YhjY with autotransporter beta-barrel domain
MTRSGPVAARVPGGTPRLLLSASAIVLLAGIPRTGLSQAAGPPDGVVAGRDQVAARAGGIGTSQVSGIVHSDAMAGGLAHRRIFGAGTAQRMAAIRHGDPMVVTAQGALAPRVALDGARTVQMPAMPGTGADWQGEYPAQPLGDGSDGMAGPFSAWSVWGRALGSWGGSDGDATAPGYARQSGGALVGADRRLAPGLTAGVTLGFLRGTVDGDAAAGEVRLDSYQASAYGLYIAPTEAPTRPFIDATIGTGLSRYDSRRTIALGTLARGDAGGTDFTAEAGLGLTARLHGVDIEPRAYLRWDRIARGSFTETGAGSLNLSIDAKSADALRAGIGISAGRTLRLSEGFVLRPEVRLGYGREMQEGPGSGSHRLDGATFAVQAARTGRNMVTAGLGVTAMRGERFAVVADYDAAQTGRGTEHVLTVGMRWIW